MNAVSPAVKHRLRFAGLYGQPLTPADLRVLRLVARDRAHAVALGYETGQLQPGTATPRPRP